MRIAIFVKKGDRDVHSRFRSRCQQRSIPTEAVDVLLAYGEQRRRAGADRLLFAPDDLPRSEAGIARIVTRVRGKASLRPSHSTRRAAGMCAEPNGTLAIEPIAPLSVSFSRHRNDVGDMP